MKKLITKLQSRRDEGATAVEYALIVALIAVVLAVGAYALGGAINSRFNSVKQCVATPASSC
ncbi:Flp family type IVb pilin [Hamadaea sp. NPDC050747]|uniref:Flp family type IVb pilin n=1 Tax=Hamadaea sp. NPDC050747 TaxID=3155789 RepID=UPI0033C56FE6